MPKVELNESETVLVALASQQYESLVARAQQILEQAETLRVTTNTSIVKRALREGALTSTKGLKGAPEIVCDKNGSPTTLVWSDAPSEQLDQKAP